MKLPWSKKPIYVADPKVELLGNDVTAGSIKITVGTHEVLLSEQQARNLWGELGAVLRKVSDSRPKGMSKEE